MTIQMLEMHLLEQQGVGWEEMPLRLKIETQGKVAEKKHIFILNQRAFMESVHGPICKWTHKV